MSRFIAPVVIALAALYSVAAVLSYTFVKSPFASGDQWPAALICSMLVLVPYAILVHVYRKAVDMSGFLATALGAAIVAAIGGVAYQGSFTFNDGEYIVNYLVAPFVQLGVVGPTFAFVNWRKEKTGADNQREN